MKKNEVLAKQRELKSWLKKIGLSQNEFAAFFLEDTYDHVTEEEIVKFQESFKKQINRESTSPVRLEAYLHFLFSTEKFKEAGYIRPQSHTKDLLEPTVTKWMKKISRELNEKIEL